ncbi:MAG: DNA translocase FtsK, partial [Chloroflexi bacterium]|nr:DNA translocase FtsK [Chloroflexota bacterium]
MAKVERAANDSPRHSPWWNFRPQAVDQALPVLKRIAHVCLVLASVGLGVLGVFAWPYLRFGLIPLGLGLAALLLALAFKPRLLLRHANLWGAYMVASLGAVGGLALYRAGWGGKFGEALAGPHQVFGWFRVSLIFLAATWVLAPKFTWRASIVTSYGIVWFTVVSLRFSRWAASKSLVPLARWGQSWWRSWRGEEASPLDEATATPEALQKNGNRASSAESEGTRGGKASHLLHSLVNDKKGPSGSTKGGHLHGGWRLPPITLLDEKEEAWVSEEENLEKARLIEQTLADYGIEITVEEIRPGPVVTQFGLVPGWIRRYKEAKERDRDGRVKLDKLGRPVVTQVEEKLRVRVDTILSREKDLALALAASSIRFEAPVPGESFIGLEVPNSSPTIVTLRSVLESNAFKTLRRKGSLPFALGEGSGGEPVVADLSDMPHLLIAGATGSGKSVCINALISCLLTEADPFALRFILVDPKRVELTPFNGIPHQVMPVVVEADQTVPILRSLITEMRNRYKQLEQAGVRNIQGFNRKTRPSEGPMPYLIVVIDELADLMMAAPADVENSLCRLAQLGRAVGIHLVVATQRPSVDVITGLIMANFPSRISFSVSSQVDSRTVLDGAGAEKLLGRG